jgi:site-specific DNA-methyltransferase (adenine-specific)
MSDIHLICGDAREHAANFEVDTIITDPVWPNCPRDYLERWGIDDPYKLLQEVLSGARCRRLVIVLRTDSDPRFLSAVPDRFPFFRTQTLPYAVPGYIGRVLGGDEVAYCFGEPLPSAPGRKVIPGYGPKAQPFMRTENGHPMSRALVHFQWLVSWWSLEGETIMDPFMGSGTTGVAAVPAGRHFVGIEKDQSFFDIACDRILTAPRQLFQVEPSVFKQMVMPS